MRKVRVIAGVIVAFLLLMFILFLVTQTAQVVALARGVNYSFGTAVLYVLLAIYVLAILVPLAMVLRLPPMLVAPEVSSPEYQQYLTRLCKRLQNNPLTKGIDVGPCFHHFSPFG